MSNIVEEEKNRYAKHLSTLFSTTSIVALSILCLINNRTIDLYSMFFLLKIVIPASICNWILGYVIGLILTSSRIKNIEARIVNEKKAYEIPSIFSANGLEESELSFNIEEAKNSNEEIKN